MAKTNKREKELAQRLHRLGLRKRVARSLAQASTRAEGQVPAPVRSALSDLRAILGEVGVPSGQKRKEAAKKAARTRKRNEAKRSAAARKAAKTRANKRERTDAMLRVGK